MITVSSHTIALACLGAAGLLVLYDMVLAIVKDSIESRKRHRPPCPPRYTGKRR